MTYSYATRAALFIAHGGLGVFPCIDKIPATRNGFYDAATTVDASVPRGRWVGVRPMPQSGIAVVDLDSYKCVTAEHRAIHAELRARLPSTLTQTTIRGGQHYFYRTPLPHIPNSASKLWPLVDVRGDGGYVVSGPGYHVEDREIADAPDWLVDELRPREQRVIRAYTAPTTSAASYGRRALVDECARVAGTPEGARNETLRDAACRIGGLVAGGHVDAHEAHSALVDAGVACGLPEREAEDVVRRALVYTRDDPRHPVPRADPLDGVEVYVGSAPVVVETRPATITVRREAPTAEQVCESVAELGGAVSDYLAWVLETADYPQPGLAVASLLALASTIGSRRLAIGGLTTSSVIVGLAPTASGKGRPQACLTEVLTECWPTLVAGSDLSSTAATVETVASAANRGEGCAFILDEYGARLKAMLDARSGHQRDMRALLLALTTTGTGTYRESRSLARGGGQRVIHAPGLTIYGSTTPAALHDALGSMALDDGMVGRHLWLDATGTLPSRRWLPPRSGVPVEVSTRVAVVKGAHEHWHRETTDDAVIYRPQEVPISDEAQAMLFGWGERLDDERRSHPGDTRAPLAGRAVEHALRTALSLTTLSGDVATPRIDVPHVRAALAVVEHSIATIASGIEEYRAESVYEGQVRRVLRALRAHAVGGGWVSQSTITRATQGIPPRVREEILHDLLAAERIEGIQHGEGRSRTQLWRICE